jgi:hypothetical protein
MAHYAFLDDDNIVTQVIVGREEGDLHEGVTDWETYYGNVMGQVCRRTSYNTQAGQHLAGGVPYRGNYAGIGYKYDAELDAFIAPQPYPSWVLNPSTYTWEAPVPFPTGEGVFEWDETLVEWVETSP